MNSVAIVGFGLIGGSLAAALRAGDPKIQIVAIDSEAVVALDATRAIADRWVPIADRVRTQIEVAAADVAVMAAPVGTIQAELPALLEHARVLTDCGSTKRAICAVARGLPRARRFVPGHPMAGGPDGGVRHARPDLFRDQTWILCPENSDADAVSTVEGLVRAVGARCLHLSSDLHDRAVARTSHLPQLLLSALAALVDESGAAVAAGPAYRAALRTAGGAESMWRDIFATNADEIAMALGEFTNELEPITRALSADRPELAPALAILERARRSRSRP